MSTPRTLYFTVETTQVRLRAYYESLTAAWKRRRAVDVKVLRVVEVARVVLVPAKIQYTAQSVPILHALKVTKKAQRNAVEKLRRV